MAKERIIAFQKGRIGLKPANPQLKGSFSRTLLPLFQKAKQAAFRPRSVASGAVQEKILTGRADVLRAIPVLTHCEKDGGPYITAGMVAVKHPETRERVIQLVEMHVKAPDRIVINPVTPMMPQAFQRAKEL